MSVLLRQKLFHRVFQKSSHIAAKHGKIFGYALSSPSSGKKNKLQMPTDARSLKSPSYSSWQKSHSSDLPVKHITCNWLSIASISSMCVIRRMKQLLAISKPDVAIRSSEMLSSCCNYVLVMEVSQTSSTASRNSEDREWPLYRKQENQLVMLAKGQ